jgi:tetratricopeptide (TPR) repeat protein
MKPCPSADELLRLLDNDLSPDEESRLLEHARACRSCQQSLEELSAREESLRLPESQPVGHTPPPAFLEDLKRVVPQLAGPPAAADAPTPSGSAPAEEPGAKQGQRTIADYEILEEIGHGGMGVVYRARHRRLGRLVALKVLRGGEYATAEERERFRKEASAAAQVQHANLVQIYEIGEEGGFPFLALEYVDGGSLDQRLARSTLSARDAAGLIETLARALQHAHQCRVIHRDIKPSNVLLAGRADIPVRDCVPKLSDFGLAKQLDAAGADTPSGAVVGTPSYMAPEQAQGKAGPTADVYGLGALLYETLTGRPPFKADNVMDTLLQVVQQEPVPPSQFQPRLPRDLETICLKCLKKPAAKRYASAGDLADDLERFLNGRPILARPVGPLERLAKWVRRHKALSGLMVAIVLGLAAGFYALVKDRQVETERRERAEKDLLAERQAAHEERVRNARAAAARGDWDHALELYEPAIADGEEDGRQLEVERLSGLLAVNRRDDLARELDRLIATPDLGKHTAQVLLLQGELDLSHQGRRQQGREAVRKALELSEQLSEAEQHYAAFLLATRPGDSFAELKRTLELDPFHHRAHRNLLMAHVLRGEAAEAERQAGFMRTYFPRDPFPDFALAMIPALQGDGKAARQKLAGLSDKLDKSRQQQIEQYIDRLADHMTTLADPANPLNQMRRLLGLTSLPPEQPLGFGVATADWLLLSIDLLKEGMEASRSPELEPKRTALRHLAEVDANYVEARSLLALAAALRGHLLVRSFADMPYPQLRQECQDIVRLAQDAAAAPTLVPRSPMRFAALTLAVSLGVNRLRMPGPLNDAQLAALRDSITLLVREAPSVAERRKALEDIVLPDLIDPMNDRIENEWCVAVAARSDDLDGRQRLLYRFGRQIVAEWQWAEPRSPVPQLWTAKVEQWAGNDEAAAQAARNAASLASSDRRVTREAEALEQEALGTLRAKYRK